MQREGCWGPLTLPVIAGLCPYLSFGLVSAGALSLPLLITSPCQTHTHTHACTRPFKLSHQCYQQVIKPSFVSVERCLATYCQSAVTTPLFFLRFPLQLCGTFPWQLLASIPKCAPSGCRAICWCVFFGVPLEACRAIRVAEGKMTRQLPWPFDLWCMRVDY